MAFWLIAVLAASLGSVAAARAADPEPTTQRLIVKFNDGSTRTIRERVARLATERHVRLSHVREMALGAHVVALEHALPMSEARAIARELASSSEVAYVHHTPIWLVMTANKSAPGTYTGTLFRTTGGPPFNTVPFPSIGTPGGALFRQVGTATIAFSDGNNATFAYTVDSVSQTKAITRQVFRAPETVCR
jgi:hypothetical protein